jgi:peptidyl-prolyl cis-trans isomerase A (cyclophilin A)
MAVIGNKLLLHSQHQQAQQRRRRKPSASLPPTKQQQQARLFKTVVMVLMILFVAGILYQTDRALFHARTAIAKHYHHKKKQKVPHYLSPDMLVGNSNKNNNNLRQRNEGQATEQEEGEGDAEVRDTTSSSGEDEEEEAIPRVEVSRGGGRRRVAFELRNLKTTDDSNTNKNDNQSTAATTGTIVLETVEEWAPLGVARFWELIDADFYVHASFFRVLPNFVAQFGIAADPVVHAAWKQHTIPDDPVVLHSNAAHTVTFAMSGADTRTTQLFINLHDNARLDAQGFAPIGHVVQGTEYLNRINDAYREQPNQGKLVQQGNAYLEHEFPNLTYIAAVRILPDEPEETE